MTEKLLLHSAFQFTKSYSKDLAYSLLIYMLYIVCRNPQRHLLSNTAELQKCEPSFSFVLLVDMTSTVVVP